VGTRTSYTYFRIIRLPSQSCLCHKVPRDVYEASTKKRRSLNCNCFIHLYTCKHYRFLHTSHVTVWPSRSPPFQWFNSRTKLVLTISLIITFLGALLFNASCPNLSPYNYSKICPVWRIRDVYPGSGFFPIPDPGSKKTWGGKINFF
jgi:hypothetical protein